MAHCWHNDTLPLALLHYEASYLLHVTLGLTNKLQQPLVLCLLQQLQITCLVMFLQCHTNEQRGAPQRRTYAYLTALVILNKRVYICGKFI